MYFLTIEEFEQSKMGNLLARILKIEDKTTKEVILTAIEHKGIDNFLQYPRLFGLSTEICEGIEHFKTFIDAYYKSEGVEKNGIGS